MDQSFHYLAMAVQATIQKKLMEELQGTELTLGQPKVLDFLRDHDGASQKEIARACHIEPGSLTSILNRMEQKALIERRSLNGNRRTCYIFLTDYGRQSKDRIEAAFDKIEKEAFAGIAEEEQEKWMRLLEQIYENLSEAEKESGRN